MSDVHGAAYNHSAEVDNQSGSLPWQSVDDYGGYGSAPTQTESYNDGDNDTDDIGTYGPIPRPVENVSYGRSGGMMTDPQRPDNGGVWS
jgi:hypothetical protein